MNLYDIKSFFDTFNIPIRELTLEDRDFLEQILLEDYWTLEYLKDQWCSVTGTHVHLNEEINKCYADNKEVPKDIEIWIEDYKYTVDGSSCLNALLSFYIVAKEVIDKDIIEAVKDRFKERGIKNEQIRRN